MANGTQTVDYDALIAKHGGTAAPPAGGGSSSVDFDSLIAKHGGAVSAAGAASSDSYWNDLKDRYSLPRGVDLSKTLMENAFNKNLTSEEFNKIDIDKFSRAYAEANPQAPSPTSFLGRSWDEVKNLFKGAFGEGALFGDPTKTSSVAGFTPPSPSSTAEALKSRAKEVVEHPAAAAGAAATDVAALSLPFLGKLGEGIWSRVSPARTVEAALGRSLTAAEADAPRAGGAIQPALANTPREVLSHAKQEGIQLTPGQATEDAMAQNLQKAGTTAAVGGKELASALAENRAKFGSAVNGFMDDVDPKRSGLSSEQAGETINRTAKVARSVAHDNAAQGYDKINYLMDSKMDGAPISSAWNKLKGDLPEGAEKAIIDQSPRSMKALVEDLLSSKPEGFAPTVAQAIQLRKFFRDLGDTEGLADKTQSTYQKLENASSSALDAHAAKLNASDDWQAANAGWKDYKQKYGDPKSALYKLIAQKDPTKIVAQLQNAPATDIELLKNEGMTAALEPLKRQVVQDIARSRFRIAHDGLGGYDDSYLRALFSPAEVKELYLKADLANRLQYDPNPSGTGANISSLSQLGFWNQAKMSAAAKLSMPRDALSFLPQKAAAQPVRTTPFAALPASIAAQVTSPVTQQPLARPDELFRRANP